MNKNEIEVAAIFAFAILDSALIVGGLLMSPDFGGAAPGIVLGLVGIMAGAALSRPSGGPQESR